MSHGWYPPTWASAHSVDPATRVRCACGRDVRADMLFDMCAQPIAQAHFVCDACKSMLHRRGHLSREAFARNAGAPPALVEKLRVADERRRATTTPGGGQ